MMASNQFGTILKFVLVSVTLFAVASSDLAGTLMTELNWEMLVGALAAQPIIIFCLGALAMRFLLLVGSPGVRFGIAYRAMVLSQGMNLILPARLSEFLKATYLRDHADVPLSNGLSAIVLERIVDVLILSTLGMIGAIQYFDRGDFMSIPVVGAALALAVFLLIRYPDLPLRLVKTVPSHRIALFLEQSYKHFSATIRIRAFWIALLLGTIAWGLSYLNFFIFLKLAGYISIGFSGALLVFVMTTLGGAIPALPGGLGTYEAAAVVALKALGYSFDEALALALTMHAAQLVLPFLMAMMIMMTERLGISSLIADLQQSAADVESGSDREGERKALHD